MNVYKMKNSIVIENMTDEDFQKLKEINEGTFNENILPRPVVRDGNGKLIKDHTPRDFYLKLQEEIFEVMSVSTFKEDMAEEIADVITVCISCLNAIGYNEEKRSELFAKVNEKNEKRGYFEEKNFSKGEFINEQGQHHTGTLRHY